MPTSSGDLTALKHCPTQGTNTGAICCEDVSLISLSNKTCVFCPPSESCNAFSDSLDESWSPFPALTSSDPDADNEYTEEFTFVASLNTSDLDLEISDSLIREAEAALQLLDEIILLPGRLKVLEAGAGTGTGSA
jgi:hypothetical protein